MHFETVFDIEQAGYRYWWAPAFGLIFVVIGASAIRLGELTHRRYAWGMIVFALVWSLGVLVFRR